MIEKVIKDVIYTDTDLAEVKVNIDENIETLQKHIKMTTDLMKAQEKLRKMILQFGIE